MGCLEEGQPAAHQAPVSAGRPLPNSPVRLWGWGAVPTGAEARRAAPPRKPGCPEATGSQWSQPAPAAAATSSPGELQPPPITASAQRCLLFLGPQFPRVSGRAAGGQDLGEDRASWVFRVRVGTRGRPWGAGRREEGGRPHQSPPEAWRGPEPPRGKQRNPVLNQRETDAVWVGGAPSRSSTLWGLEPLPTVPEGAKNQTPLLSGTCPHS